MEPRSSPFEAADREFLAKVVALLEAGLEAGEFDALTVDAEPDALAMWRDRAPERLLALVRSESDRNLVRLPLRELQDRLRHHG